MQPIQAIHSESLAESKGISWPTLILAVCVLAWFICSFVFAAARLVPLWLLAVINTYCLYASYTPIHEAIHKNISGDRKQYEWINFVIAYMLCVPLFLSYTQQRYVHLQHHAHVNDPHFDHDAWIHSRHIPLVFLKSMLYLPHQNYFAFKVWKKEKGGSRLIVLSLLDQALPWGIAISLIATGYGDIFLFVWLFPALIGISFLLFSANWIVHRDPDGTSQFANTRILGAPKGFWGDLMTYAYLGGNYHLIHHLFPRLPFYKHRAFWYRHAPALKAAGAKTYSCFDSEPE